MDNFIKYALIRALRTTCQTTVPVIENNIKTLYKRVDKIKR